VTHGAITDGDVLGAISSPRRREILRMVWEGERTAGEIAGGLPDVTFAAVSQHLARLVATGLVARRAEGRRRFYRARREALGPIGTMLETMWSDALYRLTLLAELEEARRGPARQEKRRGRR